jgi:hypothetical protein
MALESTGGAKDFRGEFREMGAKQVRSDLMMGRFIPEKRAAARLWLEQQDAADWQTQHATPVVRTSWLRSDFVKKWGPVLAGIAIAGFMLARRF